VITEEKSTEQLITEYQSKLDHITLRIEESKKQPEVVHDLREKYNELKKVLLSLYMKLDNDEEIEE